MRKNYSMPNFTSSSLNDFGALHKQQRGIRFCEEKPTMVKIGTCYFS